MAVDVAPDILELVQEKFRQYVKNNKIIQELDAKIEAGMGTFKDADIYAVEVGDMLAKAYMEITGEMLPDGKMYYNIADRVIRPTLGESYDIVNTMAVKVQKTANLEAGLGLNPVIPEISDSRVQGFIDKVSAADDFDSIKWVLEEPVRNFAQNVVDEVVRSNADFQYKAGLSPKIKRTMETTPITEYWKRVNGKVYGPYRQTQAMPCQWCQERAGTYEYEDVKNTGNDVFRRHEHCRCIVEYLPGDGTRQNVHTKTWQDENGAEIDARVARINALETIDQVRSWVELDAFIQKQGLELDATTLRRSGLTLKIAKQRVKSGFFVT